MLLCEEDQHVFKRWILPKLETISGADAGVFADYVIALVVANDSEANIKRNCLEELSDFLEDYTEPFVNDVLQALRDKSYARTPATLKANGAKPRPTASRTEQHVPAPQTAPVPSIVGTSLSKRAELSRPPQTSKKRKLVEREASQPRDGHDAHYGLAPGGNRPLKQTARRGGGGEPQNAFAAFAPMPQLLNSANRFPMFPPPPPGLPPLDPRDPMAVFAMMAAFGVGLPGMATPLPLPISQGNGSIQHGSKANCLNYHTKGFCALGNLCLFEHGDPVATPVDDVPEYDPERSFLAVQPHGGVSGQEALRAQARGRKSDRTRAPFSLSGPSYDRSNTTLVVEQIPEEYFNEDSVRAFFLQFGSVLEIEMHAYKQLAIIKFEDRDAADRAYNSPKAVFENRFVKVYWHKSDSVLDAPKGAFSGLEAGEADDDEPILSREEIAKRQAELQKAFEERRNKEAEVAARAEEIEKLLKEKNEEIEEIKQQLAALFEGESFSQSLDYLQFEADNMFDKHDGTETSSVRGRAAFRGSFRGHGHSTLAPRGCGYTPFRGNYRGRGSYGAPPSGRSSVRRVDNRPRRLAVSAIEAGSRRDKALRQYLINAPDCIRLERHPEQTDTLILTFKERYQAEIFLDESLNIPDVGKLELAWIPNDAFGAADSPTAEKGEASDDDSAATIVEQDEPVKTTETELQGGAAVADGDLDVAEDVDQWL